MAKKQAKVRENGKSRGQAAMEYLMTYGWALLVIVAVIAILLVMNPLRPQEAFTFQDTGFSGSHQLIDNSGNLMFLLTNGFQRDIVVKAMNCTTDMGAQPSPSDDPSPVTIRPGEIATISVGCTGKALSVGETFQGKLWVFYNWADDPSSFPRRMTAATVVTRVLQGPPPTVICQPTGVSCTSPNRCCDGACVSNWRICRHVRDVAIAE